MKILQIIETMKFAEMMKHESPKELAKRQYGKSLISSTLAVSGHTKQLALTLKKEGKEELANKLEEVFAILQKVAKKWKAKDGLA